MARVKLDEDLPSEIVEVLRAAGHDAASVHEQGLTGALDSTLWSSVQSEARCLLTADKGFGDLQRATPGAHAGVVLFRLPHESRAGYVRLATALLRHVDLSDVSGRVIVVSPETIRIHRR